MIPQIKEINFPSYATLSSATVSLNDMGEKTISAQVKIDGSIAPNFTFDWEVEFQGERYIQPLREPQASKGNDSLCSVIDLTFQHKTIYELKRYYFVQMAPLESGTAVVDKYIASLGLNLGKFIEVFKAVIAHWFPDNEITVDFNEKWEYDEEPSFIEISYSHIWDVLLKLYEVYGVRWTIDNNVIRIGFDSEEVNHTFKYGYEGGLLKVERQVQSDQLANSLLGRGGDTNLPYRYFKDVDKENPSFQADPDWIPELANISFGNLRGKTFRDYVKGWKAAHYDGEPMAEPTEEYMKGYTDEKFNPIEYVEDKESIEKYDLLQNGLENAEDIFPTIQGVEVEGLGRVDEVVDAGQVLVDEVTSNKGKTDTETESEYSQEISGSYTTKFDGVDHSTTIHYVFQTERFEITDPTVIPYLVPDPNIEVLWEVGENYVECYNEKWEYCRRYGKIAKYYVNANNISTALFFADSDEPVINTATLQAGTRYYIKFEADISGFPKGWDKMEYDGTSNKFRGELKEFDTYGKLILNYNWVVKNIPYHGLIIKGKEADAKKVVIPANKSKTVEFTTDTFNIPIDGATNTENPVNIVTTANGLYTYETKTKVVNASTGEIVSAVNIPKGDYYLKVFVEITNNSSKTETFKVELLSSYIILPTDSEEYKPTFDIWVKNIWNTTKDVGESAETYTNRVWTPILRDRLGNEAKIVFSTGWLAGHSDYEFTIKEVKYAGGEGVQNKDGIPAEWKITLYKSDAEVEATGKWIPSTTQQANAGDKFYFIGIDMPHQYVLWAEEKLDQYKRDQLLKTANIKPTWVVQTDKVRLNESRDGEKLLDSFKIGNSITLEDDRFLKDGEKLYMQSITYTWDAQTTMFPNVEVVLSGDYKVSANPVAKLQGDIDVLTRQVGSISNVQQIVRAVGDKLYLRKDGATSETSNSVTAFRQLVSSDGYRQGAVGGTGWGLRSEQGQGIIECDKLIVRNEMQVNSLVANQVSAIGGKEILSAASIECSKVEALEQGFKCYFDQKRGSIANLFVEHDIAYSQVFNANDVEVKYYKREVIEVGDNYILLSTESDGSGAPQVGDVIVQYGNTEDQNRQFVIIRDVIGGGYERMLCGLDSIDSNGIEYFFAGRMDGGTPRWFVGDANQYVKFEDGKIALECKQVGMTSEGSSDDTVRIWAGADNIHKDSAPFRVQQDGKVIASNAVVEGEINANSGTIGNMRITENGLDVANETSGNIGINDAKGVFVINRKLLSNTLGTASFGTCGFAAVESIVGIDGNVCIGIPDNTNSKVAAYLAAAEDGNYAFAAVSGQFLGLRTKTRVIAEDSDLSTTDYNILVNAESGPTITLTLPDEKERIDGQEYIIETLGADVTINATRNIYNHETQGISKTLTLTNRGVFRLKYYHRPPAYPFHWTLVWIAKY